jgi:enoyl-CoA hydratase/carnithine racemase
VGKAKAMDLCLTGRMMDAAEAERAGLAARVVPADKLMEEALSAARTIAAFSRPALMACKEAVNPSVSSGEFSTAFLLPTIRKRGCAHSSKNVRRRSAIDE